MATYQPAPEFDGFTPDDWKEALQTWQPGGGDQISNDGGSTSIEVVIDADKQRAAMTYCLGWSWCDDAAPYELHRVPGPAHPFYGPQWRPVSVSFQKFSPIGNDDNPNGEPYVEDTLGVGGIERYGNYQKSRMTVQFGLMPYTLDEDDDPDWSGKEYDRYCTKFQVEPNLEVLMADTDRYLTWTEGTPAGPPAQKVPGTIGLYLAKTSFVLSWHMVPDRFIFDASNLPTKILACVGTVNDDDFMGFPEGTLLLQAPRFEKKLFPFYSEDGRAFHYTVHLPFLYFNPARGVSPGVVKGHNNFPYAPDGLFYYAERANGDPYLPVSDFEAMFTHVLS